MSSKPQPAWATPQMKKELVKLEEELRLLAEDRDVAAQQATRKLAMAMLRLAEVLVHGEPKTSSAPKHHV